jgi:hypothetical protein
VCTGRDFAVEECIGGGAGQVGGDAETELSGGVIFLTQSLPHVTGCDLYLLMVEGAHDARRMWNHGFHMAACASSDDG